MFFSLAQQPPLRRPARFLVHSRSLAIGTTVFLCERAIPQRTVRPDCIVVAAPSFDQDLCRPEREEDLVVQRFIPELGVEALPVTVLLR
jgi:hypothetical protein